MTDQPTKREWLAAVRRATWPSSARTFRGTVLDIAPLVVECGTLSVPQTLIERRTGLPSRTVEHHLRRLCEMGWLVHERRGGQGRLPLYRVQIPEPSAPIEPVRGRNSPPQVADYSTGIVRNPQVDHRPGIVRKLVADSEEIARGEAEHVAVGPDRVRRPVRSAARGATHGTALPAPQLARVIPLRASRNATTAPAALAPTADGDTGPMTPPTTQDEPGSARCVGGAGGRRLGPPKRDATRTHDPPGLDQPPT